MNESLAVTRTDWPRIILAFGVAVGLIILASKVDPNSAAEVMLGMSETTTSGLAAVDC